LSHGQEADSKVTVARHQLTPLLLIDNAHAIAAGFMKMRPEHESCKALEASSGSSIDDDNKLILQWQLQRSPLIYISFVLNSQSMFPCSYFVF
jgi:hypothetical protein